MTDTNSRLTNQFTKAVRRDTLKEVAELANHFDNTNHSLTEFYRELERMAKE